MNSAMMSTGQSHSDDSTRYMNEQISQGTQHKHQQREQQSEQGAFTVNSGRSSARQDHSDEHASRKNGKISPGTQHKHQQREQQSEQGAFTVNSGRVSARQDHSDQHASRTNGKSEDQYIGGEQPRKGVAMNSAMMPTGQSHSDYSTSYMNEQISLGTQRKHQHREQQSEQSSLTVNSGRASAWQDHFDEHASRKNGKSEDQYIGGEQPRKGVAMNSAMMPTGQSHSDYSTSYMNEQISLGTQRKHQHREQQSEQGAFTVNSGRASARQDHSDEHASRKNGNSEDQYKGGEQPRKGVAMNSAMMPTGQSHSDYSTSYMNEQISLGTQRKHQQREQQSEQGAFTVNSGRASARQVHSDQRASSKNGKSEEQYIGGEQPRKGVAKNSAMMPTGQSHPDYSILYMNEQSEDQYRGGEQPQKGVVMNSAMMPTGQSHSDYSTSHMNEQISQGTQRKHQQREQQSEQAAFTVKSGRMSARQDHSDEHESRTNGKSIVVDHRIRQEPFSYTDALNLETMDARHGPSDHYAAYANQESGDRYIRQGPTSQNAALNSVTLGARHSRPDHHAAYDNHEIPGSENQQQNEPRRFSVNQAVMATGRDRHGTGRSFYRWPHPDY